jgi:TRAP-type C4-dicarboxylate transport system permease small subunit
MSPAEAVTAVRGGRLMWILRLSEILSKTLMVFAAFWAFSIAFYILLDVVLRNLDLPIEGTAEIITNSIVTIIFLQIAYGIHIRGMIRADFLMRFMGPRTQMTIDLANYLCGAIFFSIVIIGQWDPAWMALANNEFEGEGAVRIPTWPSRFAILIGSGLAVVNYLLLIVREFIEPPESRAGASH